MSRQKLCFAAIVTLYFVVIYSLAPDLYGTESYPISLLSQLHEIIIIA